MKTWAVDTSVAVAALDSSHAAHQVCLARVLQHRPALAGHAAFETYSVLTRLPGDLRVGPALAHRIILQAFPERCFLGARDQAALLDLLPRADLAGGSVYDAMVGFAAKQSGRTLITRDGRAERVYKRISAPYEFVRS
jgi:predicted nucleic acid-binding protein